MIAVDGAWALPFNVRRPLAGVFWSPKLRSAHLKVDQVPSPIRFHNRNQGKGRILAKYLSQNISLDWARKFP